MEGKNQSHEIKFTIVGTHDSPDANPIPYKRLTQKMKYTSRGVEYEHWKAHVVKAFLDSLDRQAQQPYIRNLQLKRKPIALQPNQKARLTVHIRFKDEKHGDPDNVAKGINDALFIDDKHVDITTHHECRCKYGEADVTITFI